MNETNSHIHAFPLEQLFLRLEVAGFALSPADRLRGLQILSGPAKAYLNEPEQLKKLLAPALVRNAAEQEKFYEIFDLYFRDINQPFLGEEEKKPDGIRSWMSWLLLALVAGTLAYAAYKMWVESPSSSDLSIYIEGPTYASVGDTLPFLNLSKYSGDSSELKWQWSYGTPGQEPELSDSTHFNWTFVIPPLVTDIFQKEVRLSVYYPEKDSLFESRVDLSIFCPSAPAINGINGKQKLNIGEETTFTAAASNTELQITRHRGREIITGPAKNWIYEWDFGDGTVDQGQYFTQHKYEENGLYRLKLLVTDTTGEGFCSTVHNLEVKVGAEQAFLPLVSLQEDHLVPIAVWDWMYFVILALLGMGIVYHWVRWLARPQLKQRKKQPTPEQKALQARFELNDKAPYFIPLRDQDQQIQPASQHLQFADALRLRQEGLRKEIDINATLNATIDRGGFPSVQYRYATQASEYLFLIDEQSRASHLGRLFKYLAESLRGQDVHMSIFYYRLHFNRFWNHYHPNGLSIDQLRKEFPNYRLVVLGDLHELIDPHAKRQPHLRPALANMLKQWPQRLLLSPVPPVSWTYREKLLARVFNVFPSDVDGIAAAALHLESDGELLADGPAFEQWKKEQIEQRNDNDTEHRRWRRWRDIEKYLKGYDEELTRWFKALAVFPMNSWEMTIAIGRSLGIEITYDKLLQLARIPALQQDRFDERLRQDLLAILDKQDESQARKAVRAELEAVKSISTNSSASRDLETTLAIQSFSLDPEAEENQDTIRFLLEKGMLSPAQEKELDWVSSKHFGEAEQGLKTKSAAVSKNPSVNIREWLNAGDYVAEDKPDKKESRFNEDFWKALLLTFAYTLLLVGGWQLGGSDPLYKMVFWEDASKRTVSAKEPLRDYYFVKEELVIDSAIIYNNWGVERSGLAQTQDTSTAHYFHNALASANFVLKNTGEIFQNKSIGYSLANANLAKLYYNSGVNYLNQYLNDSLGAAILPEALTILNRAYISDSIDLDVLHAKGVVHYYLGSPEDSVQYYYQALDSLGYFSSLNYTPNLQTLLGQERSRIVNVAVNKWANQALEVKIDYYLNDIVDTDAYISVTPIGDGKQPEAVIKDLDALPITLSFDFKPPSRSPGKLSSFIVKLHRRLNNNLIDSLVENYKHDWKKPRVEETPIQTQDSQIDAMEQTIIGASIHGQVIDERSRKGLEGVRVILLEPATRENRKYIQLETITDEYGRFGFETEEAIEDKSLNLQTYKTGYKENFDYYSGDKINLLTSEEGVLIRLENKVPQPRMIRINGGTFERIDITEADYVDKTGNNRPVLIQQQATLDDFLMSPYEVTYAEYDLYCEMVAHEKATDNGWGRRSFPLTQISWIDAIEYCNWLSEKHGFQAVYQTGKVVDINTSANGYRLPTEAEWEYAARGGIMGNESDIYAGSSIIDEVAWYDGNSQNQTHPVGKKQPNNAGLYDMSGNVWEWCQDWYGTYSSKPQTNPLNSDYGSHRIIRGGAWIQQADDCRIDLRRYIKPNEKHSWLGFRLVRNVQ